MMTTPVFDGNVLTGIRTVATRGWTDLAGLVESAINQVVSKSLFGGHAQVTVAGDFVPIVT